MSKLADELERLCCAETEGKFFDCVTDNITEIISALRLAAAQPNREALALLKVARVHLLSMQCLLADKLIGKALLLIAGASTKSDGVSCHTRRLDDLGSVQDGLKMSTDGQRTDTLDMSSSERRDVNPDVTAGETAPFPSDPPVPDVREALEDIISATRRNTLAVGFNHSAPNAKELQSRLDEVEQIALSALATPTSSGGSVQESIATKQSTDATCDSATETAGGEA